MSSQTIQQVFETAVLQYRSGSVADASRLCGQILSQSPDYLPAMMLMSELARVKGDLDQSEAMLRRGIAKNPNVGELHGNLSMLLLARGRLDDAIDECRTTIALMPKSPEARNNLALALMSRGEFEAAIAECHQALLLNPKHVPAMTNLGNALRYAGRLDEAIAAYREVLRLKPDYLEARNNLGAALALQGDVDSALREHQEALRLNLQIQTTHTHLGNVLLSMGRLDESIASYRRAIELRPDDPRLYSPMLCAMQFSTSYAAADILREHRVWNDRHAEPLRRLQIAHDNDPDPARRLRVGFVSPDFREHVASHFTVPMLRSLDRSQFEIVCYSGGREDVMTERIRPLANLWRRTMGMNDQQLVQQIRDDRIDILVDVSMHMTGNRLLALARRPAPVQVTWLAYPGTTGLSAIDYRFSDPHLDPPGSESGKYSEETLRLPDTFWCYDPMSDEPVAELPSLANGYVTFGCVNAFYKVNDDVLARWAGVMREVAGSRLILLAPEGSSRERVKTKLAAEGVDPGRLEFVGFRPRAEYLRLYNRIDIALDTLPYNGHTTTLDGLWMGVPVVTQVGKTVVGRAGLSQLTNLNLPELVAEGDDAFVRIAAELAGDRARLMELRRSLRDRMRSSPLMDATKYARGMATAFREIWHRWCAGPRA